MKIAYFDCTSGISGDMTLGALIDAGASASLIEAGIKSLGLGDLSLRVETVKKYGFRATQVTIEHPPEHAHRHLHHIEEMLDRGDISDEARDLAKRIFRNLGQAEASVHGTTIQKVHFHEVGAVDSIADITGAAIALTELGVDRVEASPIPTGCGTIEIAHGKVGVPAPATAELLRGVPLAECDIEAELTTPTGAAIMKTTSKAFGPLPSMRISDIGYGSGMMDLEKQANVLRVLIGEDDQSASDHNFEADTVIVMESNVDDSTPEELAFCMDKLFAAGALDVYQTPIVMKKGRAASTITALCSADDSSSVEEVFFSHCSTIGVRRWKAQRTKLIRQEHSVETEFGKVQGKCVWLPSAQWRFAAEHDSLRATADASSTSIAAVRDAAMKAFQPQDLSPPAT